jgi:hypothetical protein
MSRFPNDKIISLYSSQFCPYIIMNKISWFTLLFNILNLKFCAREAELSECEYCLACAHLQFQMDITGADPGSGERGAPSTSH